MNYFSNYLKKNNDFSISNISPKLPLLEFSFFKRIVYNKNFLIMKKKYKFNKIY
jgi:hypothetical protein